MSDIWLYSMPIFFKFCYINLRQNDRVSYNAGLLYGIKDWIIIFFFLKKRFFIKSVIFKHINVCIGKIWEIINVIEFVKSYVSREREMLKSFLTKSDLSISWYQILQKYSECISFSTLICIDIVSVSIMGSELGWFSA